MKKVAILLLIVSLLSSGCGTTQPERTDAIVGGAAIGNSVGVVRTRHAVPCGLLADLAGIIAAILICYLFFN